MSGTSGHALLPLPPGSPGQGRPSWNQRKPGKLFHAPFIPWRGCHPDLGVQVLGISSYLHVALTVHPLQPSPDSDCSLPFLPPWGALSDPKTLYRPSLSSSHGQAWLRLGEGPGSLTDLASLASGLLGYQLFQQVSSALFKWVHPCPPRPCSSHGGGGDAGGVELIYRKEPHVWAETALL